MDVNIRIIQQKDFLCMTSTGEVDLEESKRLLVRIASLNRPPIKRDVLIDVRNAIDRIGIVEISMLMGFMIDHADSFRSKLAILTEPGPRLELARFAELYADNRGFFVAGFDNFEEAILWLATIVPVEMEDE
jgi:hypothetical protein